MKKTLVLGASPNPTRFSYKAVKSLVRHGYEAVLIGNRKGQISWQDIIIGTPEIADLHTVTIYLNPENQKEYYEYIISLKPQRLIFNPGSENQELIQLAMENGIEVCVACTLIMLNSNNY